MVGNAGAGELALSNGQIMDSRLSPAEAHSILRQQLVPLVDPWGLGPADIHRLTRQKSIYAYAPGNVILPSGVRGDCLGLVVQGQIVVHSSRFGMVRPAIILLPGSTFGETMLTEGRPSATTLQALTRCQVWFLRRTDLQALVDERRTEQQVDTLWQLGTWSTVTLIVGVILLLLLVLPATRQAAALAPMVLGQWCHQQGYDACTEPAWSIAANLAPGDANPLLALGNLHFEQGEIGTAEQSFEAARSLAPTSPEVLNNLGLIYAHQGDHERAIVAFRQALQLEPGAAAVEHNLGLSLQAIQAYDEALAHYQLALVLDEPQTSTLSNLAIAYYEAGQPLQASEVARRALHQGAELASAYTVLGAVALDSQELELALANLHRAIALDAEYSPAYFYLGLAYKAVDQPTEALLAFERALATAEDEVTRVRIRRYLNELYEIERQAATF
jgi:tetratricopeptide (TPR) repeat protein